MGLFFFFSALPFSFLVLEPNFVCYDIRWEKCIRSPKRVLRGMVLVNLPSPGKRPERRRRHLGNLLAEA